jgi:hypothetical protein
MSQLTSLVLAEDIFRSIVAVDVDVLAIGNELSNKFNVSWVSCRTTSSDSATRETSISLAEMESVAMLLSVGIAIIFSSPDMLKDERKRKKIKKSLMMRENISRLT